MGLQERRYAAGLALVLIVLAAYVVTLAVRALGDSAPLTEVAWQGPMLLALAVGGTAYALTYGTMRWRARREPAADERDVRVERAATAAGGGITSLAVLASLLLLAFDASTFWVAQTLFLGSALGSVIESSTALAAYRGEVDA
ncbi:hypothetical protein [Demequina silvatica]|uniref:hypothetical protein n=1 Tax=Demequina silvatica TaxID=1638988 RepID=UPI0007841DA7|nr:hypothetical protein [Demequina silvatica]